MLTQNQFLIVCVCFRGAVFPAYLKNFCAIFFEQNNRVISKGRINYRNAFYHFCIQLITILEIIKDEKESVYDLT